MEIIRNLSERSFPAGSGRITLNNSLRDYLHLLKSSDFKLLVLKCAGSYSRVFTVYEKSYMPQILVGEFFFSFRNPRSQKRRNTKKKKKRKR